MEHGSRIREILKNGAKNKSSGGKIILNRISNFENFKKVGQIILGGKTRITDPDGKKIPLDWDQQGNSKNYGRVDGPSWPRKPLLLSSFLQRLACNPLGADLDSLALCEGLQKELAVKFRGCFDEPQTGRSDFSGMLARQREERRIASKIKICDHQIQIGKKQAQVSGWSQENRRKSASRWHRTEIES